MAESGSRERLALLPAAPARAKRAAPVALDPGDDAATAFGTIARGCIGHLVDNQDYVSERGSGKAIHQMRVALRRLRATLALFDGLLGPEMLAELKVNLAWLRDNALSMIAQGDPRPAIHQANLIPPGLLNGRPDVFLPYLVLRERVHGEFVRSRDSGRSIKPATMFPPTI